MFFGFRILKKSYSTISKVIFKDSFCKNFFHYVSRKTVEIFVEFNHQFLNGENFFELGEDNREYYCKYLRMNPERFEHLFNTVAPLLSKT